MRPWVQFPVVGTGGGPGIVSLSRWRKERLTDDVLRGVQEPFRTPAARAALIRTAIDLHPRGLYEIARKLPSLRIPVRVIYGEHDRILPDVARTMRRVQRDLPQATVTRLPDCGHFLQEDAPDEVGELLAAFLRG